MARSVDPQPLPEIVAAAHRRAEEAGFTLSCEPGVGRFIAALAAAVPRSGRILETGTGVGTGCAWIVHGLSGRADVEVISVEIDQDRAAIAAKADWPPFVSLRVGDVRGLYPSIGSFDLIFADSPGGKWDGLARTIAALRPGGVLLVDDMRPGTWMNDEHREKTSLVRETLLSHPDLVAAELAGASGMILAVKRRR